MSVAAVQALPAAARRRLITVALLRAWAVSAALVALYYLAPLDRLTGFGLFVALALGLLTLAAVTVHEIRAILRSRYPAVRAIQALATTAPLFLLLFAATYFQMARTYEGSFNTSLTRTDALYFTVTVFTTVGFGDIRATSQIARVLVTAQMILDLVILGLGFRVFVGAVQLARQDNSVGRAAGGPS